jgi:hypothetical protein
MDNGTRWKRSVSKWLIECRRFTPIVVNRHQFITRIIREIGSFEVEDYKPTLTQRSVAQKARDPLPPGFSLRAVCEILSRQLQFYECAQPGKKSVSSPDAAAPAIIFSRAWRG